MGVDVMDRIAVVTVSEQPCPHHFVMDMGCWLHLEMSWTKATLNCRTVKKAVSKTIGAESASLVFEAQRLLPNKRFATRKDYGRNTL